MIPRYMPKLIIMAFAVLTGGIIGYEVMFQYLASGAEGNHYMIELQDGIVILSNLTVETPHPLIGDVIFSNDGSTCWKIEEKIGAFYYKIQENCEGEL